MRFISSEDVCSIVERSIDISFEEDIISNHY
nr:MAG TPA: hypothetical protein [Caudoviricetes sp.]